MAAPTVQSLSDLISQYTQAFAPQKALLDQQITANDASGADQVKGLDAAKTTAFGGIGQEAQNRGMSFSGFTPDQEAKYVGATYLPALAKLRSTIAGVRGQLLGQEAGLATSANTSALDARSSQEKSLQAWQAAQDQMAFEANQNNLSRAQQTKLAQLQASTSRANSSAKSGPTPPQNMASALAGQVGRDGYVSPGTYSAGKAQWTAGNYGTAKQYDQLFAAFRNPKDGGYKLG